MFLNDRNSAERIRAQRTLFSLWMAIAALVVIVTMAAGLASSAHAAQAIDTLTTGSISNPPPVHDKSHQGFMMGFVIMSFLMMLAACSGLARRSIKDVKRYQSRKNR